MTDIATPPARLTCEFCECQISGTTGEMVRRSKKATAMLGLDDDNAKLREKVTSLETTLADVRTKLEAAEAAAKQVPAGVGAGADDDDW